jgi:hypothetical protein
MGSLRSLRHDSEKIRMCEFLAEDLSEPGYYIEDYSMPGWYGLRSHNGEPRELKNVTIGKISLRNLPIMPRTVIVDVFSKSGQERIRRAIDTDSGELYSHYSVLTGKIAYDTGLITLVFEDATGLFSTDTIRIIYKADNYG